MNLHIERLSTGQLEKAKLLFKLLSEVLGEGGSETSEQYIDQLLQQDHFWAVAAFEGDSMLGGLTAHILPMTKSEQSELLIYDVAVDKSVQRRGVGTMLMGWVLNQATALGMASVFVLSDNVDDSAINFYRKLNGAASPVTLFEWN